MPRRAQTGSAHPRPGWRADHRPQGRCVNLQLVRNKIPGEPGLTIDQHETAEARSRPAGEYAVAATAMVVPYGAEVDSFCMNADAFKLSLIQKAIAGNLAALTALLAQADPWLRRRLERRLPTNLRAAVSVDDLLQETRLATFQNITQFVVQDSDSFDRWVGTIALRRLHNVIRAHRTLKRGGDARAVATVGSEDSAVALLDLMTVSGDSPSRRAASAEAVAAVQAAMEQLPADYQQAVRLVYLEGCSAAEAAGQMGRTERAIHNLCYKAKLHLRGLLGSGSRYFSRSG